jgi:hypothetical protein
VGRFDFCTPVLHMSASVNMTHPHSMSGCNSDSSWLSASEQRSIQRCLQRQWRRYRELQRCFTDSALPENKAQWFAHVPLSFYAPLHSGSSALLLPAACTIQAAVRGWLCRRRLPQRLLWHEAQGRQCFKHMWLDHAKSMTCTVGLQQDLLAQRLRSTLATHRHMQQCQVCIQA